MIKQKIPWWNIRFEEEEALSVYNAVKNRHLSMGEITSSFEEKISEELDVPYVVATSSGSASLLIALIALGIKPGDEVIIPNRTWIASVHAVLILGAKPVLIDVLPDIPIMDTNEIENAITPKTKAIIPTQLCGRAVDMERVWDISYRRGIHVIEDSAQALFSKYNNQFMGTYSDIGCFSLSVSKLLPTGQGGLLVTRKKQLYEKFLKIRTHGLNDFVKFTPFDTFGFNFRITDLQSSLGIERLKKVSNNIDSIIKIYNLYKDNIKNESHIEIIPVDIEKGEIPLYTEVVVKDRDQFVNHLENCLIQTRTLYPDIDTAKYLNTNKDFPNSRPFGDKGLTLPSGPDQSIENIKYVIQKINEYKT